MKQNTKFLWIYIAILFSFALILILFAGLTRNNLKKVNKELEALKTENFKLTSQKEVLVKAIGGNAEITQKLLDAYVIYSLGDKEAANAKISNLNTALLNQMQLNIYNTIIGEWLKC